MTVSDQDSQLERCKGEKGAGAEEGPRGLESGAACADRPQKRRSKQLLAASLLRLMKTESYREITVSQIAGAAGLARRTFYRCFDSVDDLLGYILQELCDDFAHALVSRLTSSDIREVVRLYFAYWQQHKELLLLLRRNGMLYLLLERVMPQARREIRGAFGSDSPGGHEAEELEYASYFTAGGAWNLLVKWLDDGAEKTPEEMADVMGVIAAVFR